VEAANEYFLARSLCYPRFLPSRPEKARGSPQHSLYLSGDKEEEEYERESQGNGELHVEPPPASEDSGETNFWAIEVDERVKVCPNAGAPAP
jgi:hypothetical protein